MKKWDRNHVKLQDFIIFRWLKDKLGLQLSPVYTAVWSKFLGGEGVADWEGVAVKDAWSGVVGVGGSLRSIPKTS